MNWLHPYPKAYNLYQLSSRQEDFEKAYLAARTLEYRLYPDEIVRQLPYLDSRHPQAQEWALRQANTAALLVQLATLPPEAKVLDLGCGNGWFTGRIAASCPAEVLGADINERELLQAASLFATNRCHFAYGDIFDDVWPTQYFEVIMLNSCIQYFPSLSHLLERLQHLLRPNGYIHILDSPIYD
ncbi:MAG: methyltransferase domain-containing protein, partial [Bacteroidota bacterium]